MRCVALLLTTAMIITVAPMRIAMAAPPPADTSRTAAQDFEDGTKAFTAGDYRRAGALFDDAYRKKPHPSVLWNAARSWEHAGELARAANLYERYLQDAEPQARDRDSAQQGLKQLATKLARIDVTGAGSSGARVDDQELIGKTIWVVPGEHVTTGAVGRTPIKKTVSVTAGQTMSVALDLPPPPSVVVPPQKREEGFRLPWVVVAAGGALTLAAGGVTIWSGLDTNAKRRDWDSAPVEEHTQQRKDDGLARQTRTNILVGVTAGLAVLTGVAAFFVDWKQEFKTPPTTTTTGRLLVRPTLGPTGGGLVVDGRLF